MSVRSRALTASLGLVVALALTIGPAGVAGADPPEPTDFRSTVRGAEPSLLAGVEARVIGGDAFLELRVPRGVTAQVPDYGTEDDPEPRPYLRFEADGTVRENQRAAATSANQSRYPGTEVFPSGGGPPVWRTVATNGRWAWHDHRIHWMSPRPPEAVGSDGTVDLGGADGRWEVPVTVDQEAYLIWGTLVLLDAPSPAPWVALAILVAGAGLAVGARRAHPSRSRKLLALGCATLAGFAIAASIAQWRAAPPGSGATPTTAGIAAAALVGSLGAAIGPSRFRLVAWAAAAAALIGWGLARWTVLTRVILPTTLPAGLDRAVTASALGLGLAAAVLLIWRPPIRSTRSA